MPMSGMPSDTGSCRFSKEVTGVQRVQYPVSRGLPLTGCATSIQSFTRICSQSCSGFYLKTEVVAAVRCEMQVGTAEAVGGEETPGAVVASRLPLGSRHLGALEPHGPRLHSSVVGQKPEHTGPVI